MPFCPVHLPGRESRSTEPAFTGMGPLIEALANEMEPFLARPYALLGHSMGAGIAWELTRELRRRGLPLPRALVVSSARAPLLRRMEPPAERAGSAVRHVDGAPMRHASLSHLASRR